MSYTLRPRHHAMTREPVVRVAATACLRSGSPRWRSDRRAMPMRMTSICVASIFRSSARGHHQTTLTRPSRRNPNSAGCEPRNQNSKRATVHAVALSLGTHISINDLLETPHGVYWVATNGGGVARFNRTDAGGLGGREGWWPEIREPSRFTVIPVGDDAQMTPDLADVGPCIAPRVGRLRHSRRPTSSRYSPTSTMR
jgi:hypothetical protein